MTVPVPGNCGWIRKKAQDGLHADSLLLGSSPGGRGEYELSPAQLYSPEPLLFPDL